MREIINAIKVLEKMQLTGVNYNYIKKYVDKLNIIALNNGLVLYRKGVENNLIYARRCRTINKRLCPTENKFRIAFIADLHSGSSLADIEKLTRFLNAAAAQGVKYVCILGDIVNGIYGYSCKNINRIYKRLTMDYDSQIDLVVNTLNKYDFNYLGIPGNHDYSFELAGFVNPIHIIQRKLYKKFVYIPSYQTNILINDFAINLAHLFFTGNTEDTENMWKKDKFAKDYADNHKSFVLDNGKKYQIKLFAVGHVHKHVTFVNNTEGYMVIQPGSIVSSSGHSIGYIVEVNKNNLTLI